MAVSFDSRERPILSSHLNAKYSWEVTFVLSDAYQFPVIELSSNISNISNLSVTSAISSGRKLQRYILRKFSQISRRNISENLFSWSKYHKTLSIWKTLYTSHEKYHESDELTVSNFTAKIEIMKLFRKIFTTSKTHQFFVELAIKDMATIL